MQRISVVIPSYNHARFVAEAIRSVGAQTYPNVELIVVDDGSDDESREVIRASLAEISGQQTRFLEQEHAGASRAIARGAAEASGDILAILNSDDRYATDRLARMMGEVPEHGDFLAFSKVRMIDASGAEDPPTSGPNVGYQHGLYEAIRCPTVGFALLRNNFAVSSGNLLFSRNLFQKLGGFAEFELASDWDFLLRALFYVEPIFVPEPLFDYRTHGHNTRLQISADLANREGAEIINRYFSSCREAQPENRQAPCERNWPVFFDLFVSRYNAWFGRGPIRSWMDAPPEAVASTTNHERWRSWTGAVDFERVDDCDYLVDSALGPDHRAALAIVRELFISRSHPLAEEEGPGEETLAQVFDRQLPGRPRFERIAWKPTIDRRYAPAPRASRSQRIGKALKRTTDRLMLQFRIGSPGWAESLRSAAIIWRSGIFDDAYYREQASGAGRASTSSIWHYVRRGAGEGRDPLPLFQNDFYLENNPDVKTAKMNPLAHFLATGGREGRDPNPFFDTSFYCAVYADVAEDGTNPLVHYIKYGEAEGRQPHRLFDSAFYAKRNAHEFGERMGALSHYVASGRAQGFAISPRQELRRCLEESDRRESVDGLDPREQTRIAELMKRFRFSGFFDVDFYVSGKCDDLGDSFDPLLHFLERGAIEGVPFCPPDKLERRLRKIEVDNPARPELAYLRELASTEDENDREQRGDEDRSVVIYVSSLGNSFFAEIAALLAHGFTAAGASVRVVDETWQAEGTVDHEIIVAPHEFFLLGKGRDRLSRSFLARCSLWIAEQPGSEFFAMCLWFARFARGILDINPQTALVWGTLGFRARAFPLGHIQNFEDYADNLELSETIRNMQTVETREYVGSVDDALTGRPLDIFCNAVLTERRDRFFAGNAALFSELRCALYMPTPSRPLSEQVASALHTRDATALGQRSKVQLNIHRGDLPYFEWHRLIVRGIWQKSVVVSEPSPRIPGLVPGEHYVECDLEEMPQKLFWLLRTPEGQSEAEAIRKRAFETLVARYSLETIASRFLAEDAR
jgi:glycosyltransferase involved in cell wall biosynthesis